jgi:hypothetical protein
MTTLSEKKSIERRVAPRKDLALRVDLKVLPDKDVQGILGGAGYPELSVQSLAMTRPRAGMEGCATLDISFTGVALRCQKALKQGAAAALDLHLPGERTVIKLLGEVVWSAEIQGEARAGIRIAALEDEAAQRFQGFLAS